MEIDTTKDNIIDALKISPRDMRVFLRACDTITSRAKNELELISWFNNEMDKNQIFKKCVLLSAAIGAGAAFAKINNATEQLMDDIGKGGD